MDVTPRDYDCMRVTGYPEAIASPTARPTACSLPREQIVHQAPPHRSTERARNSGQERKKRFVDLRPPRFLRKKEIGQPLHHRHKRSDQEYPAPGLSRTQTSKQHARRQHYHRRQQQITYFDVHPPRQRSDQEYPAPGLSRTQTSKQHARRQHYHRRQQQITYFDVHPPRQRSE